ncbi:MAG: SDR family oxidoreductase [Tibeticola sp.]
MKILILGGTRFLGRHIAEQALAQGHAVTLFHRGRCGAGLLPEAEHRIGDRNADLQVLSGGTWDACIDTSAYSPRQVATAAEALAGRIGRYQLISSISVYEFADGAVGADEDNPLQQLADPLTETVDERTYGGLKALCEAQAQQAFGAECLIARPGLIVGPYDPTGRFTWWVQRMLRGGEVLAPGDPATPVQWLDARDAARWLLLQAQQGSAGVFNLVGPQDAMTLGEWLTRIRAVLNPSATLRWVAEDWLLGQGVAPWSDLPVWLPRSMAGLHRTSNRRALLTGFAPSALEETIRDVAAALSQTPVPCGVGLPWQRERQLLAAWRRQST